MKLTCFVKPPEFRNRLMMMVGVLLKRLEKLISKEVRTDAVCCCRGNAWRSDKRGGKGIMESRLGRTELLLGSENMEKLKKARVAVFGVGGVGGYVVEALARCGIGTLDLIDNDEIAESNLNRQIIATVSTIGRPKVEVARDRVKEINPDCQVNARQIFFLPETAAEFDFPAYDYVVDAIDTVTGKLMLVECAKAAGTRIISSMGAGNKLDPTAFKVSDIYQTKVCPLAKVMRRELRKRGIKALKVVYSEEEPLTPGAGNAVRKQEGAGSISVERETGAEACASGSGSVRRKQTPGSIAFVPSVAGLILAGEVVKDLCGS